MRKFCFFMTSAPVWFHLAERMDASGIASPVIWLGDNRHLKNAQRRFPECTVADMNTAVHYPWRFQNINYNSEYGEFFSSPNYSRVVEICTKLLDRLDHVGMFTRLDREMYIKLLACWALKEISQKKPEALLMAEAPHSYAQYLIYEIFLFLKLPVAYILAWSIQPLVMLYHVQADALIASTKSQTITEWEKMKCSLVTYTSKVANAKNYAQYEPIGIKTQKTTSSASLGIQQNFLKRKLLPIAVEWNRNRKFAASKEYLPVNPHGFGVLFSSWVRRSKRKKLKKAYEEKVGYFDDNTPYVFVALHYEPERTTTPDGGYYHDQLLAILELRKILPDEIAIYVKEHPSQFLIAKGIRGRSPLFYNLINHIKNTRLISNDFDSHTLITNSIFTATITGSSAIEAAVLGKQSIIFGTPWFKGLPNTIQWNSELTYADVLSRETKSVEEINEFLQGLMERYTVPCFRNELGINDISAVGKSDQFVAAEIDGVVDLCTQFFLKSENMDTRQPCE